MYWWVSATRSFIWKFEIKAETGPTLRSDSEKQAQKYLDVLWNQQGINQLIYFGFCSESPELLSLVEPDQINVSDVILWI